MSWYPASRARLCMAALAHGMSFASTACSVNRNSDAFTIAPSANARSRSLGSKPSMRFHSARYGAAGSWACSASTDRTASATPTGRRDDRPWRTIVS